MHQFVLLAYCRHSFYDALARTRTRFKCPQEQIQHFGQVLPPLTQGQKQLYEVGSQQMSNLSQMVLAQTVQACDGFPLVVALCSDALLENWPYCACHGRRE